MNAKHWGTFTEDTEAGLGWAALPRVCCYNSTWQMPFYCSCSVLPFAFATLVFVIWCSVLFSLSFYLGIGVGIFLSLYFQPYGWYLYIPQYLSSTVHTLNTILSFCKSTQIMHFKSKKKYLSHFFNSKSTAPSFIWHQWRNRANWRAPLGITHTTLRKHKTIVTCKGVAGFPCVFFGSPVVYGALM